MSSRITRRFDALAKENRAALITFITAGDPTMDESARILDALPEAGADIIELGVPFTDPMADGPAIQMAGRRALKTGATLRKTLAMVAEFRKKDTTTPIILMGYYNPIYIFGAEAFAKAAKEAGVDGIIVVDLPPEEANELQQHLDGVDFVPLVTPTTSDDRLPLVLKKAGGFIYYVSVMGVTGTASASQSDLAQAMTRLRSKVDLPVAIGFGIRSSEQAAEAARLADGVVVGTMLVQKIAEKLDQNDRPLPDMLANVIDTTRTLARAVRSARK